MKIKAMQIVFGIAAHLIMFLLFFGGAVGSAHADLPVDSKLSGSWYDPDHNGEGFALQVLENNAALIYWFTYDAFGAQRWFISAGELDNGIALFDELLVTNGPVFGDEFDTNDLEYSDVGDLKIEWSDCWNAKATYSVNGVSGSQSLIRLTTLAGLDCEEPVSNPSAASGSWFDQTHNGEGLAIEALDNGDVLVYWFSYDEQGKQAWFFGVGEPEGEDIFVAEMYITSGGRFGPNFDPELVQADPWGSLLINLDCSYGKFDYASNLPEFGLGKQTLTRLTSVGKPDCNAHSPNILLLIADDLGLDASNQYDVAAEHPVTPTLDHLADQGLVFENAWSNPTCSPTRAGILTGKFGTRTGVLTAGDVLSTDEISLQSYIHQYLPGKYTDAVIGKWHLGPQPGGQNHPGELGVSHFAGITGGGVDDYEDWPLTINGQRSRETNYASSKLVDLAIEWTGEQENPWFLWLAFNAPHTPFHLPPNELHNRDLSGNDADITADPLPYYFAAIEAMDTEIGRFLDSLDEKARENTVVIFVGDNGTPGKVAQYPYSRGKSKGSLYQGGVNVPLFISGPGITRIGERESALVNTTDLFSTIAALAGVNVEQIHDSRSFKSLLSNAQGHDRYVQYSEQSTDSGEEWTVSDGIYKLLDSGAGSQQLYHLTIDPFENTDLLQTNAAPADVVEDLQFLADQIRQGAGNEKSFPIVDTGQSECYDDLGSAINCPAQAEAFHGQDAQHTVNKPDYTDNGDGTISDVITGLMWQQSPDTNEDSVIDSRDKLTVTEAQNYCDNLDLAGKTDWWLPDIKQLYSLIDFGGIDPGAYEGVDTSGLIPFIDAAYFNFAYGDTNAGERIIDAQYASSTFYVATTGNDGGQSLFGVNFADGRIKGYGLVKMGQEKTFYVICTRGNSNHGQNDFLANGQGAVIDRATELMWAIDDSIVGLNWEQALAWVESQNAANYLGHNDWRIPNAKELQSLVDYSRSPDTSGSAAIDSLFNVTSIINEAGQTDYPAYWTGTTHVNRTTNPGEAGVYVSFGRAMGYMNNSWIDVHGAGAQRSDPKAGDPDNYPLGRGPQGDAIRIYNHVRLVRDAQ